MRATLAGCGKSNLGLGRHKIIAYNYLMRGLDHQQSAMFRFPIIFGQRTGVHLELFSTTGARLDPDLVVNFSGSTDFSHTVTLTFVQLLDANGQPVSNPGLTARAEYSSRNAPFTSRQRNRAQFIRSAHQPPGSPSPPRWRWGRPALQRCALGRAGVRVRQARSRCVPLRLRFAPRPQRPTIPPT